MASYIALLHKDPGSDYGVSFPDFPGCVTAGKTLEEARQLAREALEFHVEGMMEDGQVIPEASDLDAVVADKASADAVHFIVDLNVSELSGPAERINISVPKKALRYIDEAAAASGESRSAYMVRSSVSMRGRDARTGMFIVSAVSKAKERMPLPGKGDARARPREEPHSSRRKSK